MITFWAYHFAYFVSVAVVDNEFLNSNLPSCRFIFHACGDVKRGSKLSVLVEALQNNQEDGREESPDSKMNDFSNFGDLIELLVPRRKFEHVGGKKYNVALSDSGDLFGLLVGCNLVVAQLLSCQDWKSLSPCS